MNNTLLVRPKQIAKIFVTTAALFLSISLIAQAQDFPPLDARHWGVVLEHPDMKKVKVTADVPYMKNEKGNLNIDIYTPLNMKPGEQRPAVVFLNAIGERDGQAKVKSWGIYRTWPQLIAANGYVGISMETDGAHIQESIEGVFKFLNDKGKDYNVDASRLGVYAASANVNQAGIYLMKPNAYSGIKAAVLYYGGVPPGPFRKDLPVLFVIAESDVPRGGFGNLWTEVLKNNAPWTITMGSGLPHAFDAFSDNDQAKKMVKQTISFWKNQLDPIPASTAPRAAARDILAAQFGHDDVKAANLLKPWVQEHPNDIDALQGYANSLKNSGKFVEAEAEYKKYLKARPDDAGAQSELASLEFTLNKPAEAEQLIASAEKSGPLPRFAYVGLGTTLYNLKNYDLSAKYYEKALAIEPREVDYYNLACSYALGGQKDKAFLNLNKSIEGGFTSKQQFEGDGDLESLRGDGRYKELLSKLK